MDTKAQTTTAAMSMMLLFLLLFVLPFKAEAVVRYGEALCQEDGYDCVKVQRGETWDSLFPDENQRAIVMRLNRMNIAVRSGIIIAVPEDINKLDYMQLSPFEPSMAPTGSKIIIVDPTLLAFGAYDENGRLVRWGPAVMGKNWCADINASCRTKTGLFKIYEKRGEGCFSSKFPIPDGGAPMPYCMFFNGGYAIHAAELPGYNASHGCVRVFDEDALWLNQDFADRGTQVLVKPYHSS